MKYFFTTLLAFVWLASTGLLHAAATTASAAAAAPTALSCTDLKGPGNGKSLTEADCGGDSDLCLADGDFNDEVNEHGRRIFADEHDIYDLTEGLSELELEKEPAPQEKTAISAAPKEKKKRKKTIRAMDIPRVVAEEEPAQITDELEKLNAVLEAESISAILNYFHEEKVSVPDTVQLVKIALNGQRFVSAYVLLNALPANAPIDEKDAASFRQHMLSNLDLGELLADALDQAIKEQDVQVAYWLIKIRLFPISYFQTKITEPVKTNLIKEMDQILTTWTKDKVSQFIALFNQDFADVLELGKHNFDLADFALSHICRNEYRALLTHQNQVGYLSFMITAGVAKKSYFNNQAVRRINRDFQSKFPEQYAMFMASISKEELEALTVLSAP